MVFHVIEKKHIYNGQITDVFFIYSLFVHIIKIIVNKVTFIVTENINPNIRNSKKSTINTTSLSQSKILWYVKWKPHLFILISYICYYIIIFIKKQANKTNFLFIFSFLLSLLFSLALFLASIYLIQ